LTRLVQEAPLNWRQRIVEASSDPSFRVSLTSEPAAMPEAALYHDVTEYVRDEMNRVERFAEGDTRRQNVGFALQILQCRLASSPAVDPLRVSRQVGQVADEVLQHLLVELGADVRVTLEIEATVPGGADERVQRTITENCRSLKFGDFGFERTSRER
jgi:hypothetical protein